MIDIGRDEYDTRCQSLYHGIPTHVGGQEDEDIGRHFFKELQEAIRSSQGQSIDTFYDENIIARTRPLG